MLIHSKPWDERDPNELVLGELFCCATNDPVIAKKLPYLVDLFYIYGMDIKTINTVEENGEIQHPLWCLAFCQNIYGLKTLKILLDHNLDYFSAEELVNHILVDMEICDGCRVEDAWFLERTISALKMIMLTASYPHIINDSKYIREVIDLENNRKENLIGFRNWNAYTYCIDMSTCDHLPYGLRNAALTIKDTTTNKIVWKMKL